MRIIDLTLTLRHGMRGVEFETARTVERDGWNARTLRLYSHAGTHMDAQTHFAAGPETIDEIPLERCLGSAWVVNLDGLETSSRCRVANDRARLSARLFPRQSPSASRGRLPCLLPVEQRHPGRASSTRSRTGCALSSVAVTQGAHRHAPIPGRLYSHR